MCGIFGYLGPKKNSPQLVLEGLRKLDYRGYASWGIVAKKKKSSNLIFEKHTGKISQAKTSLSSSSCTLGHTRWATHGKVNQTNAHPQFASQGQIAVVHNGIIENFEDLKRKLQKKGFDPDKPRNLAKSVTVK